MACGGFDMSFFQAILLGILQGLTEFLPISSSGHLSIFKNLLKINLETGILYDVLLHVATLLSICIVYFRDVVRLIVEFIMIIVDIFRNLGILFKNAFSDSDDEYIKLTRTSYKKFVVLIIVTSIPTGVIGFLMQDIVGTVGTTLLIPGLCLMISGGVLLIADMMPSGKKKPKDVTYLNAFSIGMTQGIASLPGLSRSGTTITACLLCGFDRRFAVKYSFIMSIPAILGALLLQMKDMTTVTVETTEIISYIVGMVVATIVGLVSIKVMMAIVQSKKFKGFAVYCLIVGALSIIGFLVML